MAAVGAGWAVQFTGISELPGRSPVQSRSGKLLSWDRAAQRWSRLSKVLKNSGKEIRAASAPRILLSP